MTRAAPEHPLTPPYDPWRHLADGWPQVRLRIMPLRGLLLGELRYPEIRLRADSGHAQQRCTLAHEIVHLERGTADCGAFAAKEERQVHALAARRLIRPHELARALLDLGTSTGAGAGPGVLAEALDVDVETLVLRLQLLSPTDRKQLHRHGARHSLLGGAA